MPPPAVSAVDLDQYLADSARLLTAYHYQAAIEMLEAACRQLPRSAELRFRLGVARQRTNCVQGAVEDFRYALSVEPVHLDARVGLASALAKQGGYDEACRLLQSVLRDKPGHPPAIITLADIGHHCPDTGNAVDMLCRITQTPGVDRRIVARAHFSLGRIHDRNADYDQAFASYDAGNRMMFEGFDCGKFRQDMELLADFFSAGFHERLPVAETADETPVFIVGMPRSGTSLVEQILDSHTAVYGAGELETVHQLIRTLSQRRDGRGRYPWCLEKTPARELTGLAGSYLQGLRKHAQAAQRITDKMPRNFMHLGFIRLLLPNARVIFCRRDPLDTCLSCYFQDFAGAHPYSYALDALGCYFRAVEQLMAHWSRVLDMPFMEVRYEDLVMDLESNTRRLLEFVGLEWQEACLKFYKTERTVATASMEQVRQPLYTSSVGRWKHYESHLGPLIEALGA